MNINRKNDLKQDYFIESCDLFTFLMKKYNYYYSGDILLQ